MKCEHHAGCEKQYTHKVVNKTSDITLYLCDEHCQEYVEGVTAEGDVMKVYTCHRKQKSTRKTPKTNHFKKLN